MVFLRPVAKRKSRMSNLQYTLSRLLLEPISPVEQIPLIESLDIARQDSNAFAEIALFMLAHARCLRNVPPETIDIVGTGGDGLGTLNFSTMAAIVAARAGALVAKHGNRSLTSKTGSFDLLQRLAVEIPETPEQAERILQQQHLVFLFAPFFHPISAKVAEARKILGQQKRPTIFNIMGALLNPARVKRGLWGVYQAALIPVFAETLQQLGVEYGYVVHGEGLDEATLTGVTHYAKLTPGKIEYGTFAPEDFGLQRCKLSELLGGDIDHNVAEAKAILSGKTQGPKRDMVLLNAALALEASTAFAVNAKTWIEKLKKEVV
jgi:anthranilate phosphoribosyltransferase